MKSNYSQQYKALLCALIMARHECGMTQKQLAMKLNKPQSFVSKFENGERRIDVIELMEIARALNSDYKKILQSVDQ